MVRVYTDITYSENNLAILPMKILIAITSELKFLPIFILILICFCFLHWACSAYITKNIAKSLQNIERKEKFIQNRRLGEIKVFWIAVYDFHVDINMIIKLLNLPGSVWCDQVFLYLQLTLHTAT